MFLRSGRVYGYISENEKGVWKPYFDNDNDNNNNNNNNNILIIIIIIIIRLWDFIVQCDRKIEVRRPDIVYIDKKERNVVIIDVAIPGDVRVKERNLRS